MEEMKRKDYNQPTIKVVKLRATGMLMVSTTSQSASRNNYGTANNGVADSEKNEQGEWEWN